MTTTGSYGTIEEVISGQTMGSGVFDMTTGEELVAAPMDPYGSNLGDEEFYYGIQPASYDENGYLTEDYSLYTKKLYFGAAAAVEERDDVSDLIDSALDLIDPGAINIHIDKISTTLMTEDTNTYLEDKDVEITLATGQQVTYTKEELVTEGSPTLEHGEYTLYSPIQKFASGFPYPTIVSENTEALTDAQARNLFPVANDGALLGSDDLEVVNLSLEYESKEYDGLILKYAGLPGMSSEAIANSMLVKKAIEDKYASMASDLYQTMISREYVGKKIKQNITFPTLSLEEAFGTETAPTLTVETTATGEYS